MLAARLLITSVVSFNTFYITINQFRIRIRISHHNVSIHPILLLIMKIEKSELSKKMFQYILYYY